jgi:dephospho-CoA kinase
VSAAPAPVAGGPALRVGLTGGLASGKSTVARQLAAAGCLVVDADRLVAELYQPGAAGAAAVRRLFGHGALLPDGAVDHAAVAARVFADPALRERLEAAVHPLVRERFRQLAAGHDGIVVLEATLLVEAGYGDDFDLVVTVEADPAERLARAMERGMDEAAARARLAAQGDGAARRAAAERVIENDGDLAALSRQVDALLTELHAELERRSGRP